jgi:lysozyme
MREINAAGLALVKSFEAGPMGNGKPALVTYICPAGKPTIGWGHTGPDVLPGLHISENWAGALLFKDLTWACETVSKGIENAPTSDNEFSAMVSLCFNIGAAGFLKSTVLRMHKAGRKMEAANAFSLWRKATVDGQLVDLPGLIRRRNEEANLYLTPDKPAFQEQAMPQEVAPEKPVAKSTTVVTGAVGTVAASAAVIDQIVPLMQSAKSASDIVDGLEGKALLIGLGVVVITCLVVMVWRYVVKARRGDVVVS